MIITRNMYVINNHEEVDAIYSLSWTYTSRTASWKAISSTCSGEGFFRPAGACTALPCRDWSTCSQRPRNGAQRLYS